MAGLVGSLSFSHSLYLVDFSILSKQLSFPFRQLCQADRAIVKVLMKNQSLMHAIRLLLFDDPLISVGGVRRAAGGIGCDFGYGRG